MKIVVGAALCAAALACTPEARAFGGVYYDDQVTFASADGTQLAGNVVLPVTENPNQTFPAIIFVNSWALEEHEYTAQAIKFAQDGYIVLSYSARGWGQSQGLITVAGPEDMEDLAAGIDWLEAHTRVDVNNIGMAGISYGAGISLLGLAHEPRLKTVAAMSGWGSLPAALYGGESPNLVWGGILLGSGYMLGRPSPMIPQLMGDILSDNDVASALAWAEARSPITYVDEINARGAPVYISNNFSDELFKPNSSLDLYQRLTVPKRIDLNQGIHASAEVPGLAGLQNYVWDNVHDWFDHWLKGIDNGVMDRPPVTMELMFTKERVGFEDWPSASLKTLDLYVGPRGWNLSGKGTLETVPNIRSGTDWIYSGIDSGATTGIPVASPLLESFDVPVKVWTPAILRSNGIVFETAPLASALKLRGASTMSLWITPSRPEAQLIAYLYDEDALGTGTLITHGARTLHTATPGQDIAIQIDLTATAYNIPAGHRVAVAIDTLEPLYEVPTLIPYRVDFRYSGTRQSELKLSYVP